VFWDLDFVLQGRFEGGFTCPFQHWNPFAGCDADGGSVLKDVFCVGWQCNNICDKGFVLNLGDDLAALNCR